MKRSTNQLASLDTISLYREGSLMVQVDPASSHCGHKSALDASNRLQVHYEVDLVCLPTLDARGFLVDQAELHQVLVSSITGRLIDESCELLAVRWGELLLDVIQKENPHIELISLAIKVSAFPHKGWLSATFVPQRS